jgi:hypothetical protein
LKYDDVSLAYLLESLAFRWAVVMVWLTFPLAGFALPGASAIRATKFFQCQIWANC